MYLQTFVEAHTWENLGVIPWQPTLDELNNKIETLMSTLWFKTTHKIKVKQLLDHGTYSGIEIALE
jgi:hypothetical protein